MNDHDLALAALAAWERTMEIESRDGHVYYVRTSADEAVLWALVNRMLGQEAA